MLTPMQQQYNAIKKEYPDILLLYRMGDFFELFNEDAEIASRVLGITLTGRGKDDNRTPMAGIPHHSLSNYLPKLIDAGLKVAIADQIGEAVAGKLVERKITKIITPGTVTDENSLKGDFNNYICSIYSENGQTGNVFHLAFCDMSTGIFKTFSVPNIIMIRTELYKLNPSEILLSDKQCEVFGFIDSVKITRIDNSDFFNKKYVKLLKEQLGVNSLKGFGYSEDSTETYVASTLFNYLKNNQKGNLNHIKKIQRYTYTDYMQLDSETIRNLELIYSNNGEQKSTLYYILNECKTLSGKRKLRNWILNPLLKDFQLEQRFESVDYFFQNPILMSDVREFLSNIADLERLTGRVGYGACSPKDLKTLSRSLEYSLGVIKLINTSSENLTTRLRFLLTTIEFEKINKVIEIINSNIKEEPPFSISEGDIFLDGVNSDIDEYRNVSKNSKQILVDIQKREIEKTGISSLKVSYNKVFGYYIEVTKTHINKIPQSYIRKQTLVNAERYITEELKIIEEKLLNSSDLLINLERSLFLKLVENLTEFLPSILDLADKLAELDVIINFGFISRKNNYIKPTIVNDEYLYSVVNGRHPVVEKITNNFIPNTTNFSDTTKFHILTGPNMSGKSTYIRQVALIQLMMQIGCFVPADEMKANLSDRIFTRVGASDNLSKGESTFMVEMSETANILNNATNKSLIILDEIGRGTSTFDGVAIAWAIVEYINSGIGAKTLFATHYHELIALEKYLDGIVNFNVRVESSDNNNDDLKIEFTYKIEKGGTNKSYGIHVAKIAGIPTDVIKRSGEILSRFEGEQKIESNLEEGFSINDSKKTSKIPQPPKPKQINIDQIGFL